MPETITIKNVYDELKKIEKQMVTKSEIISLIDTIEIMGNSETMKRIAESSDDIKHGRVKPVNSVREMLSEIEDA